MIYKDGKEGCTYISIEFFRNHRSLLGAIVGARMTDYDNVSWPLVLTDESGSEIWLSGCTAGYSGEGPHGTFTVLTECGFTTSREFITQNRAFEIKK